MRAYSVTYPAPAGQVVEFYGLGAFVALEPKVVELTDAQAASLRGKGLDVVELGTEPVAVKRHRKGGGSV